MTSSGSRTVLGRAPQPSGGGRDGYTGGPAWMWFLPPVLMLGLGLWDITRPSYWRDEAASLTAVHRSFAQLVRTLGHVDAVHGVYYMIMWPVVRVAGSGELVTRLPSVVAMAVAAAGVAALGRRLVSPAAGLASGLIFVILPQISRYAQDMRSYAMVAAFGTVATYLLVRAIGTSGRKRGWLAGYAGCMGVMGALNIFGILLLAAHAVTVALVCLRRDDGSVRPSLARLRGERGGDGGKGGDGREGGDGRKGGEGKAARSLAAGWVAAAVVAVALASPIILLGIAQRQTASWIKPPGLQTFVKLTQLVGPLPMAAAVVLAVALGLAASAASGRAALLAAWPRRLPAVAVPWLVVPPALLIGVSFALPLYVPRYILYCLPAVALLAGAGLAALGQAVGTGFGRAPEAGLDVLGWATGAVALLFIAVLGLSAQEAFRAPAGHGDNIRRVDSIIAGQRRPGDAVIYVGWDAHYFTAAYPYGLPQLDNVGQDKTPAQAANLTGTTWPAAVVRQRLAGISRVWLVDASGYPKSRVLSGLHVTRLRAWQIGKIWLVLYQQKPV
ncbi:MAG: glycosyltransferase family 39 protein [Streptosporangiaceae bacterium]|jgi:mannosyltransferase